MSDTEVMRGELEEAGYLIEGDEDEGYTLIYPNGGRPMLLDAESWDDAVFEAWNIAVGD